VQALDKVDGSLEWESADYGGVIRALTVDDTYVYVGGYDTQTVQALDKVDGSLEWESADYGGAIQALTVDDTYVYLGGSTTQTVQALEKVDGTLEWESAVYGGTINGLTVDDTYVYLGGFITQTVQALDKVDGSLEWESADYGGAIWALTVDDTYVYVGGSTTQTVQALDKVDGTFEWESSDYGDTIWALTVDDTYVYVGGKTTQTVQALETDGSMVLYTVTYESNGGSAVPPESVEDGNLATEPTDPTKANYTFDGWFTDDGVWSDAWDFSTDVVDDDLTLYAHYTENEYTITFDSNGGSAVDSITVDYGELVMKPQDPVLDGYTFMGWFTDEDFTMPFVFETDTMPAENMTLYAKYDNESTLIIQIAGFLIDYWIYIAGALAVYMIYDSTNSRKRKRRRKR
jgi:uncharacterized repeat protein (TIGR02543 family)